MPANEWVDTGSMVADAKSHCLLLVATGNAPVRSPQREAELCLIVVPIAMCTATQEVRRPRAKGTVSCLVAQ